jgi:hypothetical protein
MRRSAPWSCTMTAGERAKEIDVPQRTLARKADELERYGMQSQFASEE